MTDAQSELAASQKQFSPPQCLGCQQRIYGGCKGDGECPPPTLEKLARFVKAEASQLIDWAERLEGESRQFAVRMCDKYIQRIKALAHDLDALNPAEPDAEKIAAEVGVETVIEEGRR